MSKLTNNTQTIQNLINQINNLPDAGSGGTDTSDATAVANDILEGKTAYINGGKVTGTIPTVTQATPSVTINSSGLITASATQTAGYVSGGTKSGTKQLTTQAAKTITPTTSSQTAVNGGVYTTGAITVAGDEDLKASNIRYGVGIFGVSGTYTSDATATSDEIFAGETAYNSGNKVTGTFTIDDELSTQSTLLTNIVNALSTKGTPSASEDLNTELTEQESLIMELGNILDSKASGGSGGSVDTCELRVSIELPELCVNYCTVNIFEDGVFSTYTVTNQYSSFSLANVVCNGLVYINISQGTVYPGSALESISITDSARTRLFKLNAAPSETAFVRISL